MSNIEYINPNAHEVSLMGEDRQRVTIPKYTKIILSDYFMKYTPKYLRVVRILKEDKKQI